jgi:hypothetical protein
MILTTLWLGFLYFFSRSHILFSLSVGPLSVRLVGVPQVLSAGQQYSLSCEALGARPVPEISWWIGETRVDHLQKSITVRM